MTSCIDARFLTCFTLPHPSDKDYHVTVKKFLLPLALLLSSNPASAAATIALPHELAFHDCRGLICIDVALDGADPRTLLLDTGNVNSILTTETAKALSWKLDAYLRDGKPAPGLSTSGPHLVGTGPGASEAKFLVIDRKAFGDDPPPADGTLAYTFFKDRVLQIDYPQHRIRFSDVLTSSPAIISGPGKLSLITFGTKGPPIVVGSPFSVNGKSVRAQIDTCYTGTLLVYDDALMSLGLKKIGKPEFFPDTDGGVTMLAAPARSLGFGSREFSHEQPTIYFVGAGKNPVHQPDGLFEATVGNALFAHSVVTLDFHSMTMDVR